MPRLMNEGSTNDIKDGDFSFHKKMSMMNEEISRGREKRDTKQ